ncbi:MULTISPECIES: head decoration protein [Pontibacillus]|uniref:Head decoration protein n=1 Tax=Pontibacillus chungwhensis TaxID=265426 RepID=A0ABY8V1U5_9BACI|nr:MULTISPECIES: head decoration protein [Pontibacillus]MCD5324769.1 head decoration protein [Pontibacillus sp. HN14]WIF98729.1 head decoration protein [Pontibacillus chungwhensis]
MPEQLYTKTDEYSPDRLIAGNQIPLIAEGITLSADQGVLKRGTVIGVVTASGEGVLVDKSKTDGSEKAYAVLAETVDTTGEVKVTPGYITGLFNVNELAFADEDAIDDHKITMRERGLYVKDVISY